MKRLHRPLTELKSLLCDQKWNSHEWYLGDSPFPCPAAVYCFHPRFGGRQLAVPGYIRVAFGKRTVQQIPPQILTNVAKQKCPFFNHLCCKVTRRSNSLRDKVISAFSAANRSKRRRNQWSGSLFLYLAGMRLCWMILTWSFCRAIKITPPSS